MGLSPASSRGTSLYPIVSGSAFYVPSTGVAAVDTAAWQAAHDALGAFGGTIAMDAGPYVFTGGALNITKPVHVLGTGPRGASQALGSSYLTIGTVIQTTTNNGAVFTVNSDGCTFERLALAYTGGGAAVAGSAGILVATLGKSTLLQDCSFTSFYIPVDMQNGYEWTMRGLRVFDPVLYGMRVQSLALADAGDGLIDGCLIYAGPNNLTPTSGIEWNSGGGMKVIGGKINARGAAAFTVGVDWAISDGISTGVGLLEAMSIENVAYGVLVQNKAGGANTGQFSRMVIDGNQIVVAGGTGSAIAVAGGTTGRLSEITITDNVLTGSLAQVALSNVDKVRVFGNGGGLSVGAGVTNLKISAEDYAFATASRPPIAAMANGASYYDTTLNLPGFAQGTSNWRNAAGTVI